MAVRTAISLFQTGMTIDATGCPSVDFRADAPMLAIQLASAFWDQVLCLSGFLAIA